MSAGMADVLGSDRYYYLFDSFQGLPPAKEIDGAALVAWQNNKSAKEYHDNCSAGEEWARKAMEQSKARTFELVQGWFKDTLPGFKFKEPIALLRLDGDLYESTMVCLDAAFNQVVLGGLILIDDYHTWDACSRAVHDFLSRRSAVERIEQTGSLAYIKRLA